MDGVSPVRVATPSSSTATFDSLSNELVENIGRFLKLRDLGSLMLVDADRYSALRSRITEIGINAIDTDLHEGRLSDAVDRLCGLADWLSAGYFVGPDDNEMRDWDRLLERARNARFDSSCKEKLSEHLMISVWRRTGTEVAPSMELTDRLLELFIGAENLRDGVCNDTELLFAHLITKTLDKSHVLKMASGTGEIAGDSPPSMLECMISRRAAVCVVRLKVISLTRSTAEKLKALYQTLAELEIIHPLLQKGTATWLVHDAVSIGACFPKSVRQQVQAHSLEFLKSVSRTGNEAQKLISMMALGGIDFSGLQEGPEGCSLM